MREADIQREILLHFGADPRCRIWRNSTGATINQGRVIRFGLVGSADILGVLKGGRFLAIEVKTPQGQQSQQQKRFEAMVTSMGGLYVLARCVEDVERAIA
jgi:hypothetical protein